jgi:hypothetical protein
MLCLLLLASFSEFTVAREYVTKHQPVHHHVDKAAAAVAQHAHNAAVAGSGESHRLAQIAAAASAVLEVVECEYERAPAIDCALQHIDADKDGRICKEEIQQALDKVIYLWESLFTLYYSANYVLAHCDADQDGFISAEDFARSEAHCLHDCLPRRMFFEKVCNRLALLPQPLPPVTCVPPPPLPALTP